MRRRLRPRAHRRADEAAAIRRMSTLLASGATSHDVTRLVEHEVGTVLHLRECHFEQVPPHPPLVELAHHGRLDVAHRSQGRGCELPEGGLTIPAPSRGGTVGWMVCIPADPTGGVSRARRRMALALVDRLAAVVVGGGRRGAHGV